MTHRAWSLRWLIGGVYFIIMTATLGALMLYLSHQIENNSTATMRRSLMTYVRLSADMLGRLAHTQQEIGTMASRIIVSANAARWSVKRVTLLTTDGVVIAEKPSNYSSTKITRLPEEVQSALTHNEGTSLRVEPDTNETMLYIARRVTFTTTNEKGVRVPIYIKFTEPALPATPDHLAQPSRVRTVTVAIMVLATPITEVQEATENVKSAIGMAFIYAMLVLLLIPLGVSHFIVRPLTNVSTVAQHFAAGNLQERVRPGGAGEIASLGDSFNKMAEQLRLTIDNLAEERAQAEAILVSMADGVVVTDIEGVILLMNRRAEEICGVDGAEAIGKTLHEISFSPELNDLLDKTLSSGLPLQHEMTFNNNSLRTVEVHLSPVEVEDRLFGAVITLYDITLRRKLEQMHRDFVANVGHELRTPVTSIRAMAETLLDGGKDEPEMVNDFLQTIAQESERLTSLLDQLLHLAHVESNEYRNRAELLDLGALVRHVVNRVIAPITAKSQQLILDVPEKLMVTADRDSLVQILVNLLDNARKYSPEKATINVQVERDEVIRIKVSDTGYGIPPEDLNRVFERFYRVDKARTHAVGGTGLGLSIVKNLVEQQGGKIFVTSKLGEFTQFTIVLPLPEEEVVIADTTVDA